MDEVFRIGLLAAPLLRLTRAVLTLLSCSLVLFSPRF